MSPQRRFQNISSSSSSTSDKTNNLLSKSTSNISSNALSLSLSKSTSKVSGQKNLRSPSAGDVGVSDGARSKSFNTGLSAAYGLAHQAVLQHDYPLRLLHNPINVLVYQHDQAHSFVEGRIISIDYAAKVCHVRSFISNAVMQNVRFDDVIELGKMGHGTFIKKKFVK